MLKRTTASIGLLTCILALTGTARADVITDWSTVLLDTLKSTSANPPRASRAIAMVEVAMFEAVNGIDGTYERYHVTGNPARGASPVAAAATAAHEVLSSLYPSRIPVFDAQLAASLSGIPALPLERGVAWGHTCASDMLALRSNDNSALVVPYAPLGGAGYWIPTPPAFLPALLPNWPQVTPFSMTSGAQFRAAPPPAMDSSEYAAAFAEIFALGRNDSVARTADQTQIALFWADGGGTVTPPGHWIRIATSVAAAQQNKLSTNARLFALLGLGMADAAISSWDSKFAHNFCRPVTAVRTADADGNPATTQDAAWTPLIVTPPFPSYTSGHSTFSSTAAGILARVFHTDDIAFSATSDGLAGVTRSYSSFSAAAAEAGQSRIYGGIHWQFDNQAALHAGAQLAGHIYEHFLVRVGDLDDDGHVNRFDLLILRSEMGHSDSPADLDHDGDVDLKDQRILLARFDHRHKPL